MAAKHLTEPPWKQLVTSQAVKDLGLQKALAAYARLDIPNQAAEALEALKGISELALKLKKTCAARWEVVEYLDEMVKEIKKTIPGLEAKIMGAAPEEAKAAVAPAPAAKPPGKPANESAEPEENQEAKEAEAFKKDLKSQMVIALAQVKARAPGDPGQETEPKPQLKFMACLVGKSTAVIIARMVGAATRKLLPEIAGGASGGKFFQGECIFEKNAHTFVLDAVPGGLARKLAAALTAETGAKHKVRVRSTDGSTILDSDTDVDPEEAAATAPPPPKAAAPDPSAEEMAKFTARLKSLQPGLLKAIATKTPKGDEAKQRAAEAGGLAVKKDFAAAHCSLDAVEALIKQALAAPAPAAATSPKLSTYLNATRDWKAAKKTAGDGVFALKNAIFKECDKELEKAVRAKIDQLNGIINAMDDGIITKIEDAGRELDPERQAERNQELAKFAGKVLLAVSNHPLAKVIDSNPFGNFTVRRPVEDVLNRFVSEFGV